MPQKDTLKRIVIDPVTRVEGHGKVSILLDSNNKVNRVRFHIVEFRGFERFIRGRLLWEVPVISQRLCGICPVSHHLAAAKAMDYIVGVDKLTPVGEKMRRLMHYGQILQSHATHFFYLASPDLLLGIESDPAERNVVGVLGKYPELARQGILLRKFGQEIIKATAGKRIHGTGAVPGGINKNLSIPERDVFLASISNILQWTAGALKFIADFTIQNYSNLGSMGSYESNYLCIVKEDGAMDLYDGKLRAIDSKGEIIFDGIGVTEYNKFLVEEVKDWSYMKFPYIKTIGPDEGWYRVGPLARINACSYIDTPLAEKGRRDFFEFNSRPAHSTLLYHWTRLIEMLHSAEKIEELLHDPDLQSNDLLAPRGERREETMGLIEAPRGTLFHHYRVGKDDLVTMANLIVSTTQNNTAMNRSVESVVKTDFDLKPQITEGMLNRVETVIRAYDPCLSCATHAIGSMPLVVEIIDQSGNVIEKKYRECLDN